jgi:hypothetical protein
MMNLGYLCDWLGTVHMSPELKIMLGQVFKDICLIRYVRRPNDLALVFVLSIGHC